MNIVIAPNPILNEISREATEKDLPGLKELSSEMINIMYSSNGCGLAAPQVGSNIRMLVIDCDQEDGDKNPLVVVNPKILSLSDETDDEREGCLSVPGVAIKLTRPTEIELCWMDLDGKEHTSSFDGLWARCFQHEIDHLDGITMLDRPTGIRKIQVLGAYRKALAKGAKPGSDPLYVL